MQRAVGLAVCLLSMLAVADARADEPLRLGTLAPDGSRYMRDLLGLSRELDRLTDGGVKLKWYPGGALGDDVHMAGMLAAGKLDGAAFTDAGLSALVPEVRAWSFPAMFESSDEIDYLQRRMRARYEELFDRRGYVLLLWGDVGFTHVFSNYKIASLADLRKQTLWLWNDDPSAIYFAGLAGIKVTASSLRQLCDSLPQGKIDTWQFPPLAAVAFGIHRYPRYLSELRYRYMIGGMVLRKDVWQKLSASEQRALRSVSAKWERLFTTGWRVDERKAMDVIRKGGVKLVTMGARERQEFYQEAARHRAAYSRKFGIEAIMDEFSAALREYRELHR